MSEVLGLYSAEKRLTPRIAYIDVTTISTKKVLETGTTDKAVR
jgi:hypothetical protein